MYANGYSYRRKITVDNTKVAGSSDFTDFPALFYGTYSYLATVANAGKVTSSSGNDICFETTGGTKLDHELASYTATTGAIEAHIRIPTLLATTDTEIYVYYGKSGASAEQNPTGVWGSSYKAVWHLNEASGTIADSTSNNVDSTSQTITSYGSTGEISKAVDVSGSSDTINYGDVLDLGTNDMTLSMWLKTSQNPANYGFTLSKSYAAGGNYRYGVGIYNGGKARIFIQGNGGADGGGEQYILQALGQTAVTLGWTFGTSDDWGAVAVFFKEIPPQKLENYQSIKAPDGISVGERIR